MRSSKIDFYIEKSVLERRVGHVVVHTTNSAVGRNHRERESPVTLNLVSTGNKKTAHMIRKPQVYVKNEHFSELLPTATQAVLTT